MQNSLDSRTERQNQKLGAAAAGQPADPHRLCFPPRLSPSYPDLPPPHRFLTFQTFNELFSRFPHQLTSWKRPRNTFGIGVGTRWAQVKGGTTFRNREMDRQMEGMEEGWEGGKRRGWGWMIGWTRFSRVAHSLSGVPRAFLLKQTLPSAHLCTWPRMHPEKQGLSMRLWQDAVVFWFLVNIMSSPYTFLFPLPWSLWEGLWQFPAFVSKCPGPLKRGKLSYPHPSLKGIPLDG